MTECSHLDQINEGVQPQAEGCKTCLETGDTWVSTRMCLTCGYTGCCDSSKNRHARKHFKETGHPIIHSYEPGSDWKWCYIDNDYID